MNNQVLISDDLYYIGASDFRLALFENVYPVKNGASYNSYLLKDEKTVLFDTVDRAVEERFFENLISALGGRKLDYLVVHHVEPDHSSCIRRVIKEFADVKVVASQKATLMLSAYFGFDEKQAAIVKAGDSLSTGKHTLRFFAAPMVHWPEVLMSFDEYSGTLFTADAFGSFGAIEGDIFAGWQQFERDTLDEARRYYFNIVGKYGVQVQNALKGVRGLPVRTVCPLHGQVWKEDFGNFLEKYDLWSSYAPEERGVVIFCGSVYGHTLNAAEILATALAGKDVPVKVYDTSKTEISYLLAEAFRYSHIVFASVTYNAGLFVNVERLIADLKAHNFRNRRYSLIESGSWAPQSGKLMEAELSSLKNMQKVGETVSMLASVKAETVEKINALAEEIAKEFSH